jgi:hypothetical protein
MMSAAHRRPPPSEIQEFRFALVELLVGETAQVDKSGACNFDRPEQLVEFDIGGLRILILRALQQRDRRTSSASCCTFILTSPVLNAPRSSDGTARMSANY